MTSKLKILITSQKGGVGKSTVSANLAAFFAHIEQRKTSLVDLDHQATAGKWVRNAEPMGIQCVSVTTPNNKGSGLALLQAKQALRSVAYDTDVLIADLTWTDILPAEFLFDFDLVLVPTSLSRVELDSTLEFVNRFGFVFNSTMRTPPKLVIVPSRVVNLETYSNVFMQSFNTGFFLSPPVMFNESASDYFGTEFFVKSQSEEIRENFIDFGQAVVQLGAMQSSEKLAGEKQSSLYQPKMTSSILDRFRAGMNEKASIRPKNAANDYSKQSFHDRMKAALPSFLRSNQYK
jgi:cellulose biosynthesis protein BcsQ